MDPRRLISTCTIAACIATSSPSSPGYYAPPLSTPLIPRRRHERSTPPPLPPSSMPSVFLDIKGGMPTVSQSSAELTSDVRLTVVCQPILPPSDGRSLDDVLNGRRSRRPNRRRACCPLNYAYSKCRCDVG